MSENPLGNDQAKKPRWKEMKVNRINPDEILPVFVNDFFVAHSKNEFILTFSIIEPPTELESDIDLDKIDEVEARAVVKLAFTPDFARRVAKVFSQNIDSYVDKSN